MVGGCHQISKQFQSKQRQFEAFVTNELRDYFPLHTNAQNENALEFRVEEFSKMKSLNPNDNDVDYVFFGIASVSAFFVLIGFCAFLFNKMECCAVIPGFNVVDDGKWVAVVVFAIQLSLHIHYIASKY